MSYPNSPEDPYGQGGQPDGYSSQDGTGGYMPPADQSGGQPGAYPPPGDPSVGHPPPHAAQPYGQPGYGQPGYGQPGYGQPPGPGQPGPGQPGYGPPGYRQSASAMGGMPDQDERNMAMFAILGGGILGFLVPLVIFLIKKDESPFVRDQAKQALNFQLLILIGYLVSGVLTFIFIGTLLWTALWITSVVFGIIGGTAANRGEWYRFPFNVNWVQ